MRFCYRQVQLTLPVLVSFFLAAGCGRPAPESDTAQLNPGFEEFVVRYLEDYWQSHPVDATAKGIHRFDSQLAPTDQSDIREQVARLKAFLNEVEEFRESNLTLDQQVDRRLIRSDIKVRLAELETVPRWKRDPTFYIPFEGLNQLLSGEPASAQQRASSLLDRLGRLQTVFEDGRKNLDNPPRLFTRTAIRSGEGMLSLLETAVPEFAVQVPRLEPDLVRASRSGAAALRDFLAFLEEDLLPRSEGSLAVGREIYDFYLKEFHLLDHDASSLLKWGQDYFDRIERELEETAKKTDPDRSWRQITEDLRQKHPSAEGLLDAYCTEIQRARNHVVDHRLATVPASEEVRCIHTPAGQRAFSPFGVFQQPAPFSEHRIGYFILHPVEDGLPPEEKERLLQAHDFTWIEVIAPHESYPGHHLQALKAQENPRIFRKVYEAPIYSEGWGLYCEELMYETGFFKTPELTRLTQLRLRLWRAARIILDIQLHTGRMNYDEARQFLIDRVRFEPGATAGEVNIYAFRPSYVVSYLVGFSEIIKLREEYRKSRGQNFALGEFHDRLLTLGALPFPLIRQLLFSE